MNIFFTATPQTHVQATIQALQNHGHQIVGAPSGPFTNVSLLRTDVMIGPQQLCSTGQSTPWFVIVSEAP